MWIWRPAQTQCVLQLPGIKPPTSLSAQELLNSSQNLSLSHFICSNRRNYQTNHHTMNWKGLPFFSNCTSSIFKPDTLRSPQWLFYVAFSPVSRLKLTQPDTQQLRNTDICMTQTSVFSVCWANTPYALTSRKLAYWTKNGLKNPIGTHSTLHTPSDNVVQGGHLLSIVSFITTGWQIKWIKEHISMAWLQTWSQVISEVGLFSDVDSPVISQGELRPSQRYTWFYRQRRQQTQSHPGSKIS